MRRTLARVLVVAALACLALLSLAAIAVAQEQLGAQNSAAGAAAGSGPSVGANLSAFSQGPTALSVAGSSSQQRGRNRGRVAQSATGATGDVVGGSQVAGATGDATIMETNHSVLSLAGSGPTILASVSADQLGPAALSLIDGRSSQLGDNRFESAQDVTGDTGDAIAGSQVTGVADADVARISMTNSSVLGNGESGFTTGINAVRGSLGPVGFGVLGASASQVGRNDEILEQTGAGSSGDGVAGSQVAGAVGTGRDFAVMLSNRADLNRGVAGAVLIPNLILPAVVGPHALSVIHSQAQQTGDNAFTAVQTGDSLSGDGIAGSQVSGLVGQERAHLTITNQQAGEGDLAVSSTAVATNTLTVRVGALAAGIIAPQAVFAQASQHGDNDVTFEQTDSAASSNAVSSSQISGAVGGDDSTVRVMNTNAAPIALANGLSGGATSGSQITGVTAGDRSDVGVLISNTAAGLLPSLSVAQATLAVNTATANAGPIARGAVSADASQFGDDTINGTQTDNDGATATLIAGPTATAAALVANSASASQVGNDVVNLSQDSVSASGDSVAGSQVTGIVNGAGGRSVVQATNHALVAIGISGAIPVPNVANVIAGPTAAAGPSTTGLEHARASQTGDAAVTVSQNVDASTGDALGGAQVTGVTGGADRQVSVSNSGVLTLGVSAIATATNTAAGALGPQAATTVGINAMASGNGNTSLDLSQTFATSTGDAVSGSQIDGAA